MTTKRKSTAKKASVSRKKAAANKRGKAKLTQGICFTIMPFGGWFDDYYTVIYRPAIENSGLTPRRADDLYRPSTIVNDIWSYTQDARLILADLTGKNPNVFYELGLAHGLAKPAILVAESITDVPFDLRALRVIEYDKNEPGWGLTLRQKITNSINEVLAAPLQAVLPTFLEAKSSTKTPISEPQKEMLDLRQEVDSLRAELRSRPRSESRLLSSSIINGPGEATEAINYYLSIGMPKDIIIERVVERGVPRSWAEDEIDRLTRPKLLPSSLEDTLIRKSLTRKASAPRKPVTKKSNRKQKAHKKKASKEKSKTS